MGKRLLILRSFFFASAVFLATTNLARSDDVYQVIVRRQEQKKASQWTLSEWLETKNRMRLMDMWLALHTPTPFEFYLGGNMQFGQLDHGQAYKGGAGYLAAYATIFGLEFQREQSAARITNLLFHMRLFGYHNQTTNLTAHGGLRLRGQDNEYRSPVAGLTLTLYLAKYFGLDGLWTHIFNSSSNDQGNRLMGDRYEAGAFIDFKFLRIYGKYFHEQEAASITGLQPFYPIRSGAMGGITLFF